jgi:glycosyltransferase involved in cell wall biosynthesis
MDIFGLAMTFVPMPKILFISHDATRTGAPIVFLHQLKWLRENTNIEMCFLLLDGGPLISNFEELGTTWLWKVSSPPPTFSQRVIKRATGLLKKTPSHRDIVLKELDSAQFDMVYSNTVASHEVGLQLKKRWNKPWISHVHEMPFSIRSFYSNSMRPEVMDGLDRMISVSKACKRLLQENFDLKNTPVDLVYECVPTSEMKKPLRTREDVRSSWGLKNEFVVGGSGLMSWRKGIDLFIEISRIIQNSPASQEVRFVWVGAIKKDVVEGYRYECMQLGVAPSIIFTDATSDPASYFQAFDAFALTSREDPFPLVALEAAALKKPIICFENSGGIPELIEHQGGTVVPYLNIKSFADQIIRWASDRNGASIIGEAAYQEVQRYDVKNVAPQVLEIILSVLQKK